MVPLREEKPKMAFNTIRIIDLKHESHAIPLLGSELIN
jgi:hypothetical protein